MSEDTYFYGIDFKKIHLFCKVKFEDALRLKREFRQVSKIMLLIDTDKFYPVEKVDFIEETATITVEYFSLVVYEREKLEKYSEERISLNLPFDVLEFSYFFENLKEQDLEQAVM